MAIIKAEKVPVEQASAEDILGKFCYYYQQYTYAQARRLPIMRVLKLLRIAEKENARRMHGFANMLMAAHFSKNSSAMKKVVKYYEDKVKE